MLRREEMKRELNRDRAVNRDKLLDNETDDEEKEYSVGVKSAIVAIINNNIDKKDDDESKETSP